MPLRKRQKAAVDVTAAKAEDKKKSKRQRLADFFRSTKQKKTGDQDATLMPPPPDKDGARKPARDSKMAESTKPAKSSSSVEVQKAGVGQSEQLPTPPLEESHEEAKVEPLSEEQIHAIFSGAPHFFIKKTDSRSIPRASYPWDEQLAVRDVSDSVQLAQPAFSAATLHRHLPALQRSADQEKQYQGYNLDTVEVPTMLGAQGIEAGTIGFAHFLEMAKSDNIVTELQQSQTSSEYLEAVKNKEMMQYNPERLGIRRADMGLVHDRLIELGDLFEAFHDSPERITILNNQSSGDLYANLFGKFLTPPGYDDSADDPTGMKVQIDTLIKILRLKGVWHDFSLVEWRIRLGQVLWSDPEPETEDSTPQLWTEREILLLQILLACELLLRLDAVTSMDADNVIEQMHVSPQDFDGFLKLKTRKTDWDLVLARRFLENILTVKDGSLDNPMDQKSHGILSMLGSKAPKGAPKDDVILLPQHQARQLSGLLHFAQTLHWPDIDLMLTDLAQKLGTPEANKETEQQSPLYGKFLDPSTPSSISVYGTPLATPRSNGHLDSYFGNVQKPNVTRSRSSSRTLQVPLSTMLLAHADGPGHALNIGGWLSRSYLTGLILPGEAISHFLMSTLLENDKLAIAALGDAANLYGGFIYAGRTWWSKASIVARVLGRLEGAAECMGWTTFAQLPEGLSDGWYAITSDQLRFAQPLRIVAEDDLVLRDSAIVPGGDETEVKPEDLVLPSDTEQPPIPSIVFSQWNLTPVNLDLVDNDVSSGTSVDSETYIASVKFSSIARGTSHTFTLTHDIQFVTSWPCTAPTTSPTPNSLHIIKRSQTQSLSRSSSKRSVHSTRSASNRPSRQLSRRNSHGYEPLFSHPPDSPSIGPTRSFSPIPDEEPSASTSPKPEPMNSHPLHASYAYKIVPATDVLDANFILPFTMHVYSSPAPSALASPTQEKENGLTKVDNKTILVLDARASKDLELFARAWCAEKGLHAIIGRVGRTCLACCIREARGLGVNIVVRV